MPSSSKQSEAELEDPLLPTAEVEEDQSGGRGPLVKLMIGSIGVVYGDIGTSPLYTMRECFHGSFGFAATPTNVLGLVSLVIWALLLVVSAKYVLFIMRADNRGEGGILALVTLARRGGPIGPVTIGTLAIIGAALFFGDAIITPAISVLSAVEGLKLVTPAFDPFIVPVALVILIGLFVVQRHGAGAVGAYFGPIMVLWFAVLAILGIAQIVQHPGILRALSPSYAVEFFIANGWGGLIALGAVFLAVTGGEALYADLGQFGRRPLRLSWFAFVLPALALNYLGQASLVLRNPEAAANPFYALAPEFLVLPLLILATLATIIASQAVISGAFSLTRQAVQLGLYPRTKVLHTSESHFGQIYLPSMNWLLLIGVVLLVIVFESSSALAAAYGIAVTGTMTLTTLLALNVAAGVWLWRPWIVCLVIGGFLTMDIAFLGSNLLKIFEGGWMPVAVGAAMYIVMSTWRRGRDLIADRRGAGERLGSFLRRMRDEKPARVPGTAVYLTSRPDLVPQALQLNLKHNHVMHERVVLLSIETLPEPRVPREERLQLDEVIPNVLHIQAFYGFMQEPSVPRLLIEARRLGVHIDAREASFFISRIIPVPSPQPGMAIWREWLFALIARNATSAAEFFRLPTDRTIEMGERIAI